MEGTRRFRSTTHGKHLEEVLLGHGETLELLLVLDDALGEGLEGGVVGGDDLAARREWK